jgi:ParB family transcriptional regulator, chromosome partitioning protein
MAVKDRPRLGRGLKSLISTPVMVEAAGAAPVVAAVVVPVGGAGDGATVVATPPLEGKDRLVQVALDRIEANPHQPRERMDPVQLKELAASIKASGVLQPVILRPAMPGHGGRYQLVAGHRRTEASRLAGLTTIPAIVRTDSTDEHQAEWALIENIHREDLNAIERARAFKNYIEKFKVTHGQAGERLGLDRTSITNFLRLLELNAGVQELVARGILSAGHAKVLAGVTDRGMQDVLANRAAAEGLSVRKLEELIAAPPSAVDGTVTVVAGHTRTLVAKSPHILDLENELSRKLGTKVRILPSKKKNTGKIIIRYFSLDEFDRLAEKFK